MYNKPKLCSEAFRSLSTDWKLKDRTDVKLKALFLFVHERSGDFHDHLWKSSSGFQFAFNEGRMT